ncbi:FCGBP protein, partial [Herpetotheres cachinnans]|nr:FCGBP protein [Herpetotheres cachinnans]
LIDLPSSYYKHTCGLCGNYNLKPEDDVPQAGSDLAAVVAWAEGWKVLDDDDPPGEEFWADETCHSWCKCDPDLGMVVCKEAGCKVDEKCAVVKGVRRCVAKTRSVCVATGDPHYTTFDGRRYDFMGTCVYQLAALCSDDPTLVPFTVTVQNNNRGSRMVSYTKEVTLNVYNMTLSLSQTHPQKLQVNGVLVDLPFSHGNKLRAYLRGVHGFIKTDFDVIVTFDWYSYARVILPSTYSQAVCGLCGNANGDPQDDFALPSGQLANDEIQFADSWKVADIPGCWAGCTEDCKFCTEAQKRIYRGDKHCGLLIKKQGPFAACHSAIDPAPYFDDCLFDTCIYKGHQETVCQSISAYVTACQSQGIRIRQWRTAIFCSPVCPPNQHYELCGPACPATCRGQTEAEECDEPKFCTEGCFCKEGFFLSGDACVPLAQCGCLHEGRYYKTGEEFFSCPNCSERCTCKAGGAVECQPEGCAADEVCMVQDGVPGCYSRDCGLCQVLGAVSYSTFDGRPLSFAGTCTYTLAAVEAGGPKDTLVPFKVEMEKESGKEGPFIRRLLVTVHGVTVGMARGTTWEVTVDGEQHLLPLTLGKGAVTVSQEGTHRVLRVRDGLKLLYDGNAYVLLTLPDAYRRHTKGLCGNFNGDASDDLATPQELGDAWGTLTATCTHGSPPPTCPSATPGPCGLLTEAMGPFAGCHAVVTPQEYLAGCMQEQCSQQGARALCHSLQAYAAACQAAGGQLREWRAAANCPLSCPPNSHYELCTRSCDHTCASIFSTSQCTERCFEGFFFFFCFLFNGNECISMESCFFFFFCRYFEITQTVLSPDCSFFFFFWAAGGMQCRAAGCPFGQACGIKHGVRSCVEQLGRCTLAPATRFISFDGATGTTTATGIYVVSTLCDPQHAAWFRLLADVAENEDQPAVAALHLFSPQAFVTIKRDKKIWVNGFFFFFSVDVSSTLTINETQGTIWVTQKPKLVIGLSSNGEMTVTVAQDLSKHLCGLCGNYDRNAANDLRGPDGKLVGNMVAVAKAWRAPDFTNVS